MCVSDFIHLQREEEYGDRDIKFIIFVGTQMLDRQDGFDFFQIEKWDRFQIILHANLFFGSHGDNVIECDFIAISIHID